MPMKLRQHKWLHPYYELLNIDSANIDELLDRIVFVMSIAINPDGIDSVTHWYWDTLGSPSEGTTPPYLYQKYAGHDNNRDYFMNNLNETRVWSTQLFKRLFPVIVYDIHEMGQQGQDFLCLLFTIQRIQRYLQLP